MVGANSHQWSIAGEYRKCKVCGLVAHSLSDVLIKNQQPCEPSHVEAYIVGIMDEVTFINLQTNAIPYNEDLDWEMCDCTYDVNDCHCERCDECDAKYETEGHDSDCPKHEYNQEDDEE